MRVSVGWAYELNFYADIKKITNVFSKSPGYTPYLLLFAKIFK